MGLLRYRTDAARGNGMGARVVAAGAADACSLGSADLRRVMLGTGSRTDAASGSGNLVPSAIA